MDHDWNTSPKRRFWIVSNDRKAARSKRGLPAKALGVLIIFIILGSTVLVGCGGSNQPSVPSIPTITTTPSREDIIQAIRRSVDGKTYSVTTEHQESQLHTCSQFDVDLDPYMPHNPELARCPSVGASYTTWETVTERETRSCQPLPDPEYGWYVEEVGQNRWKVSLSGSEWSVEKLDGASASAGDYIKVSGFSFAIQAYQDC